MNGRGGARSSMGMLSRGLNATKLKRGSHGRAGGASGATGKERNVQATIHAHDAEKGGHGGRPPWPPFSPSTRSATASDSDEKVNAALEELRLKGDDGWDGVGLSQDITVRTGAERKGWVRSGRAGVREGRCAHTRDKRLNMIAGEQHWSAETGHGFGGGGWPSSCPSAPTKRRSHPLRRSCSVCITDSSAAQRTSARLLTAQ
ncbi:hypothetical protein FGB62_228g018 [Gracilaria domingensis]|nr:hypothetical protein FGB62_228g018 [Gracilaria domingensis]